MAIGGVNQREKQDIISEHTLLSQSHSQLELSQGKEELRERLAALASRQKNLLSCLGRQKQIAEVLTVKRVPTQRPPQMVAVPTGNATVGVPGSSHNPSHAFQLGSLTVSHPATLCGPPSAPTPNPSPTLHTPILVPAPVLAPNPIPVPAPIPIHHRPQSEVVSVQEPKTTVTANMADSSEQQKDKTHPDLAQPVPLNILITHKFLKPGNNCVTCRLLVRIILDIQSLSHAPLSLSLSV